ncbi:MAG: methylmalonyl-CoA epimerase [Candidatus Marinimicrobia bacterium]|nr:methylmalonyl-CoA epimerase [Candidatus Neomarinimicrobiota bacterium]
MKKIDHIAIAVNSLEESIRVYTSLLGVEPELETISAEKVNTAIYDLNGVSLELVEPIGDDSPITKFLEKRGEGLHHVCLEVDNLEETIDELKEKGIDIIDETPKSGAGGKKIVFLHPKSTGGVLFELNSNLKNKESDEDAD